MSTKTKEIKVESVKVRPDAIKVIKDTSRLFHNPRLTFQREPLETLQKSIAELGLIKPLLVRKSQDGYELIAGERRLRCIKNLIKADAACYDIEHEEMNRASQVYEFVDVKIVKPKSDLDMLQHAVAENMEHCEVQTWDILTLALDLESRVTESGEKEFTRRNICKIFNRSEAWMSHTLSLANLPDYAKKKLRDGELSRTGAINLLGAKTEKVPLVIETASQITKEDAANELCEASYEIEQASEIIEQATAEENKAILTGEDIAAKLAAKKLKEGHHKITAAQHRITKAEKKLNSEKISAEAINRALDELPEARETGVKLKPKSPKLLKMKVKQATELLSNASDSWIVDPETGKSYETKDLRLIITTCDWVLGKKSNSIFAILEEEYKMRSS
jgi:ParB-like chromosome segregation protein Spo0J